MVNYLQSMYSIIKDHFKQLISKSIFLFLFSGLLFGCYHTGIIDFNNDPNNKRVLVGKGNSRPFYYGIEYNYNECLDLSSLVKEFGFKKGDVIADVGASSGYMEGAFSVTCDSITFYIEDINKQYLNQKELDNVVNYFSKLRGKPQTNKFNKIIGKKYKTNLPDSLFDKIITIATFHEFVYVDYMISDIYTKLKPNGVLIICEEFSTKNDKRRTLNCGIEAYTVEEVIDIMKSHGLFITKMSAPENCYTNILFFEKDLKYSEDYYNKKKSMTSLDSIVNLISLFDKDSIAKDSMKVTTIKNKLFENKSSIFKEYIYIEDWIKGIAYKWYQKGKFQSAINLYNTNILLFPLSASNYNNLAEAYINNEQYDLALSNLKKSLELDTANNLYKEKIKNLENYLQNKKHQKQ